MNYSTNIIDDHFIVVYVPEHYKDYFLYQQPEEYLTENVTNVIKSMQISY